jgi:hypothetical protein
VLVLGENGEPVDVLDRHHRILEAALFPGFGRALLALDRVGVDVVAREAVPGGDQIGRDALRQEIGLDRDRRIDGPGAAGGADADAAHGFHATADRHVVLAGHDLRRSEVHRIQARRAEAVDLDTRYAVAETRDQSRGTSDVAARLADRIDAAEYHIVDLLCVELVAVADGGQRLRREIERGHFVQRAIGLAASARGPYVIVDKCVGHCVILQSLRRHARPCAGPPRLPCLSKVGDGRDKPGHDADVDASLRPHRLLAMSSFMISLVPA